MCVSICDFLVCGNVCVCLSMFDVYTLVVYLRSGIWGWRIDFIICRFVKLSSPWRMLSVLDAADAGGDARTPRRPRRPLAEAAAVVDSAV